ncbi:Transcriptional activator RfaH [hydrothermal vent metagenome]|uniref:Transcriptional activator RfaH n=1 Tax=hydrothermal vent metagenome TaxID=652676 RepID=A0A3B1A2P0_9ZZZZ
MHQWYVVQTKPRKELVAVENLERQGYTAYCPQISNARHRRKRWQPVTEALFPRYLFVHLNREVDNFGPIRSTLGVLNMVRFGDTPAIIQHHVIDGIKRQEQHLMEHVSNHPKWKQGDSIEIVNGPFAGMKGLFESKSGEERVIILLQLLGRDNKVNVAMNEVVSA